MRLRSLLFFAFMFFSLTKPATAQPILGPVVFVHGLCSDSDTWSHTKDVMQDQNWTFGGALKDPFDQTELSRYPANADFYLLNFADQSIISGIEGWATELQLYLQKIDQFRIGRGLPSSKFTIVGHSAGSLAARYYLQKRYRGNVSHLVTYGTPHNGAPAEGFRKLMEYVLKLFPVYYVSDSPCWNPILVEQSLGVTEMMPGSAFLNDLNAQPFPTDVQYTALIGDYGLSSDCPPASDCIVLGSSQDMRRVATPPRADLVAARTSFGKTHLDETSDAESILWALNRLIAAPGPPRSLIAVSGSSTVSIVWNSPISGLVSSYIIEAGSASGLSGLASFDTGSNRTDYFASGVGAGTYFVRVKAKNRSGIGPSSNEISFSIGSMTGSQLVGNWVNPIPGGITRVLIRSQDNNFFVNIWGTCGFFSECPLGEVPAVGGPSGPLSARWDLPGVVQTATFTLNPNGYLVVAIHLHYVDGSKPDFDFSVKLYK